MGEGILLLAHRKEAYHQMAWNLAHLLRAKGCTLPICLLTDGYVRLPKPNPFTHVAELKPEHNHPFYAKTTLNQYTPFDRTLYLDCDSYPCRNVDELFTNFDPFQIQTQSQTESGAGVDHAYQWASSKALFDHYHIDPSHPWTETNSSFILWDKGEFTDKIWKGVEHCFASDFYPGYARNIGYYPDELAFNATLAYLGIKPKYQRPIYFCDPSVYPLEPEQVTKQFHLIGLYGNDKTTHANLWRRYRFEVSQGMKAHIGKYGFKIDHTQKAANGGNRRPTYEGFRKRIELHTIFE